MPNRMGIACIVMALALAPGCSQAPQGPSEADMIAAANALDQTFMEAFNSGDVAAIAALYAPDAVSLPPDMEIARGVDQATAGLTQMFQTMPGAKVEVIESNQIPAGDKVVGWGLVRMTIPTPDGGSESATMRYTDVKTERDGKWVYILDHASVPAMAPPPAPGAPAAK